MNKYNLISIICILLLLLCSGISLAACNVSSAPVTFGSYDVFSSSPLDGEGSITVACDHTPPPTVMVSIGPSTNSGGFDPRIMRLAAGSDMLEYNFYRDAGRTEIWGDGSGPTFIESQKIFKNRDWTVPVYGRIPPLQDISAGSYSETVTVTITW